MLVKNVAALEDVPELVSCPTHHTPRCSNNSAPTLGGSPFAIRPRECTGPVHRIEEWSNIACVNQEGAESTPPCGLCRHGCRMDLL